MNYLNLIYIESKYECIICLIIICDLYLYCIGILMNYMIVYNIILYILFN